MMREPLLPFEHPSMTCDESAWVRALDHAMHAETVKTFAARLEPWLRLFPDAAVVVAGMKDADVIEFRRCMQLEREKIEAGEEFYARFGALALPKVALDASRMLYENRKLGVAWGTLVHQIAGVGTLPAGREVPNQETEQQRTQRIATTTGEESRDGDVAWVIRASDNAIYWKVGGGWTGDVNKAARFALKSHAVAAINGNRASLYGQSFPEEHMWTDNPATRAASPRSPNPPKGDATDG